jgi:CHAT domain-containing protein
LAKELPPIPIHFGRRLEFRALASARANATAADFESAPREADIVHISAHANYDRILLADGPFTTEKLSALNLAACRCRLLVLSACEAGDLKQSHALLWALVRVGVNIIGATRPVHDYTCKVFFEQFYAALLPTREAQAARSGSLREQPGSSSFDRSEKTTVNGCRAASNKRLGHW